MNDLLASPIVEPRSTPAPKGTASSPNLAKQLLDGFDHFQSRFIASFKASFKAAVYLLLACAGMALAWRFLDLYELAVRAETVQAQIALERHHFVMEQLKAGKAAMTPEEVRQAVAAGTATTPATAHIPAGKP